jgi:hypothetical protein
MPKAKKPTEKDRIDRIEEKLQGLIDYINKQVELGKWGADTFEEPYNG